ncbi:MAG: NUDIX hydrolase [Actinomycetota bacterium]
MTKLVMAAGGVIVDPARPSRVLVVHRPKYDDWSFPKGKLAKNEAPPTCARREVYEETGLVCELLEELGAVSYETPAGNLKSVRYWLMQPIAGELRANDEVDAFTWLKRQQALALLTHDHDHAVAVDATRRVKERRRAEKAARRAAAALEPRLPASALDIAP